MPEKAPSDNRRKVPYDGGQSQIRFHVANVYRNEIRSLVADGLAGEAKREHGKVGLPKPPRPTCLINRPCLPISASRPTDPARLYFCSPQIGYSRIKFLRRVQLQQWRLAAIVSIGKERKRERENPR